MYMLFPYGPLTIGTSGAALMPVLPIMLEYGSAQVNSIGLVDSGAMVNVLPYVLGIALGLDWNSITVSVPMAGNLGRHQAKGVVLVATVASYPQIRLTLAWSQSPDARLILGQVNFFMESDVCFYRSRDVFDVRPRP